MYLCFIALDQVDRKLEMLDCFQKFHSKVHPFNKRFKNVIKEVEQKYVMFSHLPVTGKMKWPGGMKQINETNAINEINSINKINKKF